jgi:nucleotide-binding universal stress UspA family protein
LALFPTRILVALERSDTARYALDAACELARSTGSEVHLVYVTVTGSAVHGRPLTPAQEERAAEDGHAVLDRGRAQAAAQGVEVAATHLRGGETVDVVLERVQQELDAGLLVIGASRSASVASRLLVPSSGGSGVVRRSTSSILVVRPPDDGVSA